MYNHTFRLYGTDLAHAQDLPRNTSVIGNGGGQPAGGLLGNTEIVMVADTTVTLTAGKSIVMEIEDSGDNKIFTSMYIVSTRTATAAANSWEAHDVIARLPVPSNAREYVRVIIATNDENVTGKVDVVFDYLPRG